MTTTNADNLISRRLYEGKKSFSKDGVSLSILIDHHTFKHASDDRGHRTQPYLEICATNDFHHLSRLVVSARKVFRRIGASDDHVKTTKTISKGGILTEAEEDVLKQKHSMLLESSDFAKDLAASYLYNRLSIVLDANNATKFTLVLSPLASDMINGNTRLDLDLEHSESNHQHDRVTALSSMNNGGNDNNVAYALHKPDSLYTASTYRRPSSPPVKRQPSVSAFNSAGNNAPSTLNLSHPPIKQKDKDQGSDNKKGQVADKGTKQKVNVRDYPFHQFTKYKEGTLPSSPRRGANHYQSSLSDQQFHHDLCVALNGYVLRPFTHPAVNVTYPVFTSTSHIHARIIHTSYFHPTNTPTNTSTNTHPYTHHLRILRGPATADAMPGPVSTIDKGSSQSPNTPLDIINPPSNTPLDVTDHQGGRRLTSIVDSLPKEVKPLSPHAVMKRNMLLSGSDMHLHSAFQSQKNLPFPFLSGNFSSWSNDN